ncbi:MAG: type II secretion system protein [Verrucomicrobiota bacterium]
MTRLPASHFRRTRVTSAFTLVEVLVAMVFMGVLMPVIVSAITLSNRTAISAERSAAAVQLAENRLGELLPGNAWSNGETRGECGPEWPGYRWEMTREEWQSGKMTQLTMRVFFPVQGQEHEVQVSTLVSATLQE